jgi:hypothetical protein
MPAGGGRPPPHGDGGRGVGQRRGRRFRFPPLAAAGPAARFPRGTTAPAAGPPPPPSRRSTKPPWPRPAAGPRRAPPRPVCPAAPPLARLRGHESLTEVERIPRPQPRTTCPARNTIWPSPGGRRTTRTGYPKTRTSVASGSARSPFPTTAPPSVRGVPDRGLRGRGRRRHRRPGLGRPRLRAARFIAGAAAHRTVAAVTSAAPVPGPAQVRPGGHLPVRRPSRFLLPAAAARG